MDSALGETKPKAYPTRTLGRPLRIVMVAHKFPPFIGGIEMHVQQVGSRMAAMGHSVSVITADPEGTLPSEETISGMSITRVRAYPRTSDIFFAPGVFNKIGPGSCDVIHVQGYHTLTPPVAILAAMRSRIPFVMTFHSGGHSSNSRQWLRAPQHAAMRPLVRQAARLIGVSRFEADRFSELVGVARNRFEVVPNGAQFETPKLTSSPDLNAPLIISIGRLERYKGHHLVIEAFADLVRRRPTARLKVLGEGPFKTDLIAQVKHLGLTESVEVGGIPPERRQEMAKTMASASLIVQMSEYEAHPIATLEALSLGRPVLAADTSGFTEMAEDGLIRCIPLNSTASEIAAAMEWEIDHPRLPTPFKLPTWEECTNSLIRIYRDVIAEGSTGGNAR
ncbi:MAG: glycosyltransferase family 4 protein [Hyphomicrobiaceae bacterium]